MLQALVTDKYAETADVCAIELRGIDGSPLPSFEAGAHVNVRVPGGLTRTYSLCNAPTDVNRYLLGIRMSANSRGGSRAMHESVRPGDRLELSPPRNGFPLVPHAGHSILVAAGIGITPILSMAEDLAVRGGSFELHYVARSREKAAFLGRIERASFASRVQLHLSGDLNGQRVDPIRIVPPPTLNGHIYICGPERFMANVDEAASELGWPRASIHREHFSGSEASPVVGSSFDVKLARSGRVIHVNAQQSVLQALQAAGVAVQSSCGQGVCGTCLTTVLAGEPEHRDLYLSSEEQARNNMFLPCCSRARSACLTLDL